MLEVLMQFVRLSSFKEMSIPDIVDFFDTELIDSIRYLYKDHRLNYDKLYQQERLHSIDNVSNKGVNYEQYIINKLTKMYHWDDILKYAIDHNKIVLDSYNKLFELSNNLKVIDKKLNKLEKKFICEKYKNTNIDTQLVLDSYNNYYNGSMYDLLFDPIWSLIDYIPQDLFISDPEFTKVLFDKSYVINFSKMIGYAKWFSKPALYLMYVIYKYRYSNYNIFESMHRLLKDKFKFKSNESDEMMYIINDICIWGKLDGIYKETDKELDSILSFLDLYRTSGIRFMYEI